MAIGEDIEKCFYHEETKQFSRVHTARWIADELGVEPAIVYAVLNRWYLARMIARVTSRGGTHLWYYRDGAMPQASKKPQH